MLPTNVRHWVTECGRSLVRAVISFLQVEVKPMDLHMYE